LIYEWSNKEMKKIVLSQYAHYSVGFTHSGVVRGDVILIYQTKQKQHQ